MDLARGETVPTRRVVRGEPKGLRERLGLPKSRCFKTKVELAWELIEGVMSRGLSFERVGLDTLYGSGWLCDKVRGAGQVL